MVHPSRRMEDSVTVDDRNVKTWLKRPQRIKILVGNILVII